MSTSDTQGTATAIAVRNRTGTGYVFHVSPAVEENGHTFDHVWVHGAVVPYSGPETYIFGCKHSGEVIDWSELTGSFWGSIDHERALHGAGYEVVWGDLR